MGAYDPLYTAAKSTDHVARGLARLLQQYQSSPYMRGLLTSYLNRIQELENAAWEVILYRLLPNAEGAQLDALGRIVGRGRGNLSDANYLLAIQAEIRINRSSGTPEDMIAIATLSLPPGDVFTYAEAYPAVALFSVITPETSTIIALLFQSLTRGKPGGVKLMLSYLTAPVADSFTFSPLAEEVASNTQGFADYYNPGIGGFFAGVLST